MARIPYVSREDLAEDKRHVYDGISGSRGSVLHVFQALLNSPEAAEVVAGVGEYIRYKSPIEPAIRETAILSVAKELNNGYEWTQHEPVARDVGVRDQVIEAIRTGRAPMGLPAKEGVYVQAAKELVRDGTLTDRTFQAILHLLGASQTVDLVVLVGYYCLLGGVISSLGVELEEGKQGSLLG